MNYALILPEIILCAVALMSLVLAMFRRDKTDDTAGYLSIFGLILSIILVVPLFNIKALLFNGFFIIDPLAIIFKIVFISISLLVAICSIAYTKKWENKPEYYFLLLCTTLGMMITASSSDLITLYIGLELTGLSSYPLVAFTKKDISSEASMKYFMFGAFFSAVTLFGISLVYGATGSTSIASALNIIDYKIALIAMLFLIAGFGFKTAIVPFHMWLADTHSGAPTSISAFLSGGIINVSFVLFFHVSSEYLRNH